jgi:CRISPR/Cas system Type II protein with McrA/HNH and RuvC-like nuclease domain
MTKLTAKQDVFVKEYILNGGNATQAAIKAGYSAKAANEQGAQNLAKPAIKRHIEKHKEDLNRKFDESLLTELKDLKEEVKRLRTLLGETSSGRKVSDSNRYAVMYRAGFKCQCCGDKPSRNNNVKLHIDHIIPFSRGGTNDESNLQVLCSTCNIAKSNFYDFDHNDGWDDE